MALRATMNVQQYDIIVKECITRPQPVTKHVVRDLNGQLAFRLTAHFILRHPETVVRRAIGVKLPHEALRIPRAEGDALLHISHDRLEVHREAIECAIAHPADVL